MKWLIYAGAFWLFSSASVAQAALSAPSQSTDGSFRISWTESGVNRCGGSTNIAYQVRETTPSGTLRTYGLTGTTTKHWNASNKDPGTYSYRVRVTTCRQTAWGHYFYYEDTNSVSVTVSPPLGPTLSVPANSDDGNFRIRWTGNGTGSCGSASSWAYRVVERDPSGTTRTYNINSASRKYWDAKYKNTGTYTYSVRANHCWNSATGRFLSSTSNTASIDVKFASSELALSAPLMNRDGNYRISWRVNGTNQCSGSTSSWSYRVTERSASGTTRTYDVRSPTQQYWDAKDKSSDTYTYTVRAHVCQQPDSHYAYFYYKDTGSASVVVDNPNRPKAANGEILYIYDALGRLEGRFDAINPNRIYQYDKAGNRESVTEQ